MTTTIKEYSASAANNIDIDIAADFPNAKMLMVAWRATDLSADDLIGVRLDQGAGVATAGYHWANEFQLSVDGTPAYLSNTSAEVAETYMQIMNSVDGADADASASGMIWIPRPRTTAAAKMVTWQSAGTDGSGTGSGIIANRGGGSLHALNGAIDTLRLFCAGGSVTATWAVTVVSFDA